MNIKNTQIYTVSLGLFDPEGNLVEEQNLTSLFSYGQQDAFVNFSGRKIYGKKLDGPYSVKYAYLYDIHGKIDGINNPIITGYYSFGLFEIPDLPDLKLYMTASDHHKFGFQIAQVNVTVKNIGSKHSFNLLTEFFDNKSFENASQLKMLESGSHKTYSFDFSNISDFSFNAITDSNDILEESNEDNNAATIKIIVNDPPSLDQIGNYTATKNDKVKINFTAHDPDGDNLSYQVNPPLFSMENEMFVWDTKDSESGNYSFNAIVSDGYLNDSVSFFVFLTGSVLNDYDNDSIEDSIDRLIGDANSINSNLNLSLKINGSQNITRIFEGVQKVELLEKKKPVLQFNFNFSEKILNLTKAEIKKQSSSAGSLLINNLEVFGDKTAYVDRVNTRLKGVCIKDVNVSSISSISSRCKSQNEFQVKCNGRLKKNYKCTLNSTINKYKVEGLKHSAVIQFKV